MEKLNIVWIKKWKIKRNLISVMTKIKAFFEKRNWNYVAIIAIIFGGAVVVYTSCWINDSDRRNIAVGIGTGIITSALVTLYLEIINAQIERKKLQKYKKMIFSPLCDSVRKLYIHIILNIDEYRVREEKKTLFFIPMKETKDPALSDANAQLQCRIFFAICYFDPALFYQHFLNFCDIKRMEILIRIPGIHGLLIQKCRFLHGLCEQLTAHERHPAFFKNGCAIYK